MWKIGFFVTLLLIAVVSAKPNLGHVRDSSGRCFSLLRARALSGPNYFQAAPQSTVNYVFKRDQLVGGSARD